MIVNTIFQLIMVMDKSTSIIMIIDKSTSPGSPNVLFPEIPWLFDYLVLSGWKVSDILHKYLFYLRTYESTFKYDEHMTKCLAKCCVLQSAPSGHVPMLKRFKVSLYSHNHNHFPALTRVAANNTHKSWLYLPFDKAQGFCL